MVLALPGSYFEAEKLTVIARNNNVKVHEFDLNDTVNKPLDILQRYWGLQDDEGHDTWLGSVFAEVAAKYKWNNLILIEVENLLVAPLDVQKSLQLLMQENFDVCYSQERITGANWVIFTAELLSGLYKNHKEIMNVYGGLSWAVKKPLYPFRIGFLHCPRTRPKIRCNLKLNTNRIFNVFKNTKNTDFDSISFSYKNWLNNSNWELPYTNFAPLKVYIEPSNICSAGCFACSAPGLQRTRGMMQIETFNKIFENLKTISDIKLEFSGAGEPFTNPNFSAMAETSCNMHTMLVTSLLAMPDSSFKPENLNMIRISVDALESEEFNRLRAGCNWKNIETFIRYLYNYKISNNLVNPLVGVTFLKHEKNAEKAKAFLNYWQQVVTPAFKRHFFKWPLNEKPEKIQWYQILGYNSLLGNNIGKPKVSYTPVKRRPCAHALLSLTILWNGDVVMCPFDLEGKNIVGNVNNQSLSEIWNNVQYSQFRKKHLNLNFDSLSPCNMCTDWYHTA